jgi:acyl-coenzyme A synthetase/AMP-(fatty) acid ligase
VWSTVAEGASELIEAACARWPERVAVHDVRGEPILFRSFFGALLGFAERAQEVGVRAGDLVALRMLDATAGAILRLALLRIGAVVVAAGSDDALSARGLTPAFALFDERPPDGLTEATRQVRVDQSWIRPPRGAVPITPGGHLVRGTSGTTGLPRLWAYSETVLAARWTLASSRMGAPSGPSFVGYGADSSPAMNHFMRSLLAGVPVVQRRPTLKASFEAIDRLGVVEAFLSPYSFNALLEIAERADRPPRALARIVVGGGGVHPDVAGRAEVAFGCPVFNSYGSSETGGISMTRVLDTVAAPGLVGRPHDGVEIAFRRHPGVDGSEILVRPRPELRVTAYPDGAPAGDGDGWIATGDLGHLDPDGRLVLKGRVHELLNVGGVKRAPGWFEAIAFGYPGILQAAAFAMPDGTGTDAVGLAVVTADDVDLTRFAQYMHDRLGPVFPLRIGQVDDVTSGASGKVDRRALCQAFISAGPV